MKVKIDIKTFGGSVLFSYESEDNTIKKTLEEAVKKGAYLRDAYLGGADLGDADLRGAYLGGADLRDAYLGGADLRGAYLRGAYLGGAYLRGADLGGAYLRGADLRGAYLRDAYLGGADLRGADLRGAYLGDAYLRGADLRGAYLRDAYLGGADLRGAENLNSDATDFWWHIHHEKLVEYLTEPIRARINYIKTEKAKNETPEQIELRLKLLKPVLGKIPSTEKGWETLHKKECPNCPWDGKSIFPNTQ